MIIVQEKEAGGNVAAVVAMVKKHFAWRGNDGVREPHPEGMLAPQTLALLLGNLGFDAHLVRGARPEDITTDDHTLSVVLCTLGGKPRYAVVTMTNRGTIHLGDTRTGQVIALPRERFTEQWYASLDGLGGGAMLFAHSLIWVSYDQKDDD